MQYSTGEVSRVWNVELTNSILNAGPRHSDWMSRWWKKWQKWCKKAQYWRGRHSVSALCSKCCCVKLCICFTWRITFVFTVYLFLFVFVLEDISMNIWIVLIFECIFFLEFFSQSKVCVLWTLCSGLFLMIDLGNYIRWEIWFISYLIFRYQRTKVKVFRFVHWYKSRWRLRLTWVLPLALNYTWCRL